MYCNYTKQKRKQAKAQGKQTVADRSPFLSTRICSVAECPPKKPFPIILFFC